MKTDKVLENYGKAVSDIGKLTQLITGTQLTKEQIFKPQFICNVTKEEYLKMVEKTKDFICRGDVFQAVISRRFETEYKDNLLNAYRVLRTTNLSPYMVFMRNDDLQLISASPETLIRLKNGKLTTFPIAGSRPRGKDLEEDLA